MLVLPSSILTFPTTMCECWGGKGGADTAKKEGRKKKETKEREKRRGTAWPARLLEFSSNHWGDKTAINPSDRGGGRRGKKKRRGDKIGKAAATPRHRGCVFCTHRRPREPPLGLWKKGGEEKEKGRREPTARFYYLRRHRKSGQIWERGKKRKRGKGALLTGSSSLRSFPRSGERRRGEGEGREKLGGKND